MSGHTWQWLALPPFGVTDNLRDYCTYRYWSDFPGRHTIQAEKSVQINRPFIFNFNEEPINSDKYVSFCRIRLIANEGKRIYAVGTSSGMSCTQTPIKWFPKPIDHINYCSGLRTLHNTETFFSRKYLKDRQQTNKVLNLVLNIDSTTTLCLFNALVK